MSITLNGKTITCEIHDQQTFSQLLKAIEDTIIAQQSQVLTRIVLNGKELSEEDETDFKNFPANRIQSLELHSREPHELALESLEDAVQIIPQVCQALQSVLQKFDQQNLKQGYQELLTVIDGLAWFFTIYTPTESLFQKQLSDSELPGCVKSLSGYLPEILDAYEKKDQTSLADLLEYEVLPHLEKIEELLPHTVNHLRSA
jgi:hypothetical protein